MKLLPLWLVTALLHGYSAARVISGLQASAGGQWLLLGALALSALLIPPALFGLRRDPTARARQLMHGVRWAGLLCLGLFSSRVVLTLARDALLVALWLVNGLVPGWLLLAPWRTVSAQAVLLLGLAVTLLGFWNARRTAVVRRVDVPIKGLPAAWHGFTVAQISDVHVGPTIGRGYLQRIVSKVNALQADLVAITGDLVDGRVSELAAQVAPLAGLSSRHGTFFVTGNHEYYSGAHAWIDELRRLGLTVLINQHVVLSSPSVPGQVSAPAGLARGDPSANPGAPRGTTGSPDIGPRLGPDIPVPPTAAASAPRTPLNLSLPRGDMTARRSPGLVELLPPPPERKSKLEQSIEDATNRDCRNAYSGAGILAVVPLAVDAVRGKGCKW